MSSHSKTNFNLFQDEVIAQTRKFSEVSAKYFASMLSFQTNLQNPEFLSTGIRTDKNLLISVLFTGTVFGEYILALNEEVAAQIIGQTLVGKTPEQQQDIQIEIADTFSELLNLIVGESILGLTETYKKLTITAPKVTFGKIRFPTVKAGKINLENVIGNIECILYVDRMKLDIAASYADTLNSLESANNELRLAMKQLQDKQEHLVQSEKLAALGTMAAGVAHEINTPLATISVAEGSLKSLVDDNPDSFDREKFSKMLNVIDQTVFRIAKITNALKDYAQSASNVNYQDVTVRHIVNEALIFCQSHLQEKGILILTGSIPEAITVNCRSQQISQTLFNILTNSCDALENADGEKWIRIDAVETADMVEIRVTDSGLGIATHIQKKIFDPFFTTKTVGQGFGLGLSIAKGIVDIHKGSIFVDATSKNTQLVVQLPKKM